MAKNDKNTAPAAVTDDMDEMIDDDFDYSKFLPEGYQAEGLRKIGSLTPIYSMQAALNEKWDPCVGRLINISVMDMGEKITDMKQRYREFALVELAHATKAVRGSGDAQEIVSLRKGDDVLVPVSGAIKNIRDLRVAAADPNNISIVVFRCVGTKKLNQPGKPSAMLVIDARIHAKTAPRTGRYILTAAQVTGQLPAGEKLAAVTPTGEVYDAATGELQNKVVGQSQAVI